MREELRADIDFQEGFVIPMDKPLHWTSFDVVRKVRYLMRGLGFNKIKVGHAGTLDPLATGVLLVCVGRATKMAESLQAERKEYVTTMELGATTPCFDMEHPIDHRYPIDHITPEAIAQVVESMKGEQLQVPPTYSAKIIDGRRAYDYAREGEQVEMRSALINIYDIEILKIEMPYLSLRIECSKGTYIRSIARDLGAKLNSGAHLKELRRTRSGNYKVEECYSVEEVEKILRTVKQN